MGVVAVVTRTAACSANKGRYVGASSSQTALTPKHNSSCPWRQHRLASGHTPDQAARVKQKKSTGTSATYATSFWLAQLVASRQEEGAPHPQITVPKLAALQPCSPTVARWKQLIWSCSQQHEEKGQILSLDVLGDSNRLKTGDTDKRSTDFITFQLRNLKKKNNEDDGCAGLNSVKGWKNY